MPLSSSELPLYQIKAGLFKGLSHPQRIRILELLLEHEELTVSQLQEQLGLEASHLSQHLSVLRKHRLVESERRASHVFYSVCNQQVGALLSTARTLLSEIISAERQRTEDIYAVLGEQK